MRAWLLGIGRGVLLAGPCVTGRLAAAGLSWCGAVVG